MINFTKCLNGFKRSVFLVENVFFQLQKSRAEGSGIYSSCWPTCSHHPLRCAHEYKSNKSGRGELSDQACKFAEAAASLKSDTGKNVFAHPVTLTIHFNKRTLHGFSDFVLSFF